MQEYRWVIVAAVQVKARAVMQHNLFWFQCAGSDILRVLFRARSVASVLWNEKLRILILQVSLLVLWLDNQHGMRLWWTRSET
eukprot:6439011-Amphidinium_carterae.1